MTIFPPAEYHQLDAEPPRRSFARGFVNSLAIYGVARRLATILHRMWLDGTDFRWSEKEALA